MTAAIADLPRVTLKPRRALPFFSRHPWVFAGAIRSVEGSPEPGSQVQLVTDRGEFIARGLFNPHSNIRVRLYSWNAEQPVDADLFARRIDAAVTLRNRCLAPEQQQACRLVFSEGDELSGLIVDRYADWLVLQINSLAISNRRQAIIDALVNRLQPRGVWLRTEKGMSRAEGLQDGDGLLWGEEPERPLIVAENGIRYGVDCVTGQKTGFYFDQRENRQAAARYAAGRNVLDLYCYTGGFALNAVQNGSAKHVLGVDSSPVALQLAAANAELNGLSTRLEFRQAAVMDVLEESAANEQRFGMIILDPPKLVRNRAGINKAVGLYKRLNSLAMSCLEPGGILVTCSCSGLVDRPTFAAMLAQAGLDSHRSVRILEARGQAIDHPVSAYCPESDYLKCFICAIDR